MSRKIPLGGDRLGTGNRADVELHGFGRSSFDTSYVWKSTAAPGVVIPFMNKVLTPGATEDIDLEALVMTHPTIGPMLSSYKVEAHVFTAPLRLYVKELHNNKLNIGKMMDKVMLPQSRLTGNVLKKSMRDIDNAHTDPSSLFRHIGITGIGGKPNADYDLPFVQRDFLGIGELVYWDIMKNYIFNKQEDNAYVIHNDFIAPDVTFITEGCYIDYGSEPIMLEQKNFGDPDPTEGTNALIWAAMECRLQTTPGDVTLNMGLIDIWVNGNWRPADEVFLDWAYSEEDNVYIGTQPAFPNGTIEQFGYFRLRADIESLRHLEPKLVPFPIVNIDTMRENLLDHETINNPFIIDENSIAPYGLKYKKTELEDGSFAFSATSPMEGLGVKTYLSDIFNNWLNTEWMDGDNGINEITAIDTSNDKVTINEIVMQKKVWEILNRIAIGDGSFYAFNEVSYDHEMRRILTTPIYEGGMSTELTFDAVVSQSASSAVGQTGGEYTQPLGTLAGRGMTNNKRKGGNITIKCDEQSYVMGVFMITPRLDYHQGNEYHVNLKSMGDLHQPGMDGIGFMDLLTDHMHFADTRPTESGVTKPTFNSAGKIPAWLHYQTAYNIVRGNFAKKYDQNFMVLTRDYEIEFDSDGVSHIKDLTTYIDPAKHNKTFAFTRRDGQNFWVQIGVDRTTRLKMSSNQIPNL